MGKGPSQVRERAQTSAGRASSMLAQRFRPGVRE